MNANELADELAFKHIAGDDSGAFSSKIIIMLRQQQAEIEALKQIIDANNLSQNIGQFVKPTNEPVAWRCKKFYKTQEGWFYNENKIGEPLYTHPVKEHDIGISHAIGFDDGFKAGMQRAVEMNVVKELTDEEIEIEWFKVFKPETGIGKNLTNGVYEFALAILKKAQEK